MKNSTIFGLMRLIASPDAQVAARLGAARAARGQRERRAVADAPGPRARRDRARPTSFSARKAATARQRSAPTGRAATSMVCTWMPLVAPSQRREAGGAALGQGAAEEEGHVRAGRERDHHHRQREGQQDAGVGQHRAALASRDCRLCRAKPPRTQPPRFAAGTASPPGDQLQPGPDGRHSSACTSGPFRSAETHARRAEHIHRAPAETPVISAMIAKVGVAARHSHLAMPSAAAAPSSSQLAPPVELA